MKNNYLNKIFLIFCLLSFISVIQNHQSKKRHLCVHEEKSKLQPIYAAEPINEADQQDNKRILQATVPMPMRVTFNFDRLYNDYLNDATTPAPSNSTSSGNKSQLIDFIQRQANAASLYISHLIKIVPATLIKFPNYNPATCGSVTVPSADVTTGLNDSDLHIYVNYEYNTTSTYLAFASMCVIQNPLGRPIFGYITYNFAYQNTTDFQSLKEFEDQLEVTIHELTHVLGFSSSAFNYWYDPETKKQYLNGSTLNKILITNQTYRGINTTNILSSPRVKAYAREYYNCSTLPGMQLENEGTPGSLGSHWERIILENEYMTASAITSDAAFSKFTSYLLMDTGWYDYVDLSIADEIQWGKNKGCNFFNLACKDNSTQYSEFSYVLNEKKCTYDYNGLGVYSTGDTFDDQCPYISQYNNADCTNQKNYADANMWNLSQTGPRPFAYFGWNSRCFDSTLFYTGWTWSGTQSCYQFNCFPGGNSLQIILNSTTIINCTQNGQSFNVSGYEGQVKCPSNIQQFCGIPDYCPDFCNSNGICLNEVCHCLGNYKGTSCSLLCNYGEFAFNGSCVTQCPTGYAANPVNHECSLCSEVQGYFLNNQASTCDKCFYGCKTCYNSSDICSTCDQTRILNGISCLCRDGFYEFQQPFCLKCEVLNCKNCTIGYDKCGICLSGYFLDPASNQSSCQICTAPCVECMNQTNNCIACQPGQVLLYNLTISPSIMNCVLACPSGYYNLSGDQFCYQCGLTCLTCQDASSCNTCRTTDFRTLDANKHCVCYSGYLEDATNASCVKCTSPCIACTGTLNNCSSCIDGYLLSNNLCVACNYACLTCQTTIDTCNQCDASRILTNGTCICKSGYYEKQQAACGQCPIGCLSCTTSSNCSQCQSGFNQVNTTCVAQCPSNQFLLSNVCTNCSSTCLTCQNSATNCLTCPSTLKFFANTCIQTCPNKTVFLTPTNQCVACYERCENCNTSTDICTSCNSLTQFRKLNASSCVCQDGYFDDGTAICQQCQANCSICISSTSCSNCSLGFYFSSTSPTCQACYYRCKTCSTANDNCTSCDASRNVSNNCICNAGYFETQQVACIKCNAECGTCANNASNCLTCAIGYNFTTNNLCTPILNCTSKQFISNGACANCSINCTTCTTSATFCLSCSSPLKLFNNTCISTCPNGTLALTTTPTQCTQCNFKCQQCSVTITNCTVCNSLAFRKLLNATCICQDGYWDDNANINCNVCKQECATCSAADSCLTCKTSYTKDSTNNCVYCDPLTSTITNNACVCNSGFYLDAYSKNCTKCYYQCKTCGQVNDVCTSCENITRVLVNISCKCIDGYYEDFNLQSIQCTQCPVGCQLCNSSSVCQTCKLGFYKDASTNLCLPCSFGCDNCTNSTVCIGCRSPQFQMNTTTQTCYSNCLVNQFIDPTNNLCSNCSSLCKACALSANNCSSCISGLSFFNNTCLQACPAGFVAFIFNTNSVCNPCIQACKTCSLVEKNCTSCPTGTFLSIGTSILYNECVNNTSCKPGFYADLSNNQCTQCNSSCLTCSIKSTNCTACVYSTLFLNNGSCVTACLSSQYSFQKVCYNCDTTCKTCALDSNLCTSCNPPQFFVGSTCVGSCPNGTYGDSATTSCLKCHFSCQTCSLGTNTSCTTCFNGMAFKNGTCLPTCNLTGGQFFDNAANQCGTCNPNCKTCFGPDDNQCTSCNSTLILNKNSSICVQTCPQSTFNNTFFNQELNLNISVCQQCAPNCLTCNGSTPKNCLTCDQTKYFTFDTNTCYCNSYENRVYNNSTNSCVCSLNSYPLPVTDATTNTTKQVCSSTCPIGQYGNQINNTCIDCNVTLCTSCSMINSNCTGCANQTNSRTILFINTTNGINGTCLNTCPTNFLNIGGVCQKCHESCVDCIDNLMNCMNCAQGFSTFNSSTAKCINQSTPPYGFYYDREINTFKMCNPACTSCFGADYNQCYACNFGYTLQTNSSICVKQCPIGCSDCLKNYDQYCLSCSANYQLQILNPFGIQLDSSNASTLTFPGQCVSNCSVLLNTSTTTTNTSLQQQTKLFFFNSNNTCIIKCPETQKFNNGTHCLQNCPINSSYFFPTNLTCVSSCPTAFLNSTKACVDFCPMNTFFDNTTKGCFDCDQTCLTCFNSTSSSCSSCQSGYFLLSNNTCVNNCSQFIFNGTCVNTCPIATYNLPTNKNCNLCHPTCGNCSGSNLPEACLSCASSNYLFTVIANNLGKCSSSCPMSAKFNQNQQCVNQCLAGYFPNFTNYQCQPCKVVCKECSTYDICTSCLNSTFILNSSTGTCTLNITCPSNCISCNANQVCSACLDKFYLYSTNNTCLSTCPNNTLGLNGSCQSGVSLVCPAGLFKDYVTNLCTPCSSKCTTCTNQTVCQSCALGFTFSNYACLDNNICDLTCGKCNGPLQNNCTLCISALINNISTPLFLYNETSFTARCIEALKCPQFAFIGYNNNTCVDICPGGFYGDIQSKLCKRCSSLCQNCSGPSEKECVTCNTGMILIQYENYCAQNTSCYPSCLQCSGPQKNNCLSCSSTSYFFYNSECLTACPSTASYILGGKCLATCPANYFVNPTNNYCVQCPRGCDTCSSATACLSCKQFYTFNSTSLTCSVICGEGTYMSTDSTGSVLCLPCSQTCAECIDNTTCLKCGIGYFKSVSDCLAVCPNGKYGDYNSRTCEQCYSSCSSCKGPSEFNCLSCSSAGNYLLFSNSGSQCVSQCPSGYFGISNYTNPYNTSLTNTKFCQICHYLCKTCDGPASNSCLSCPTDFFLNTVTKTCVKYSDCPTSYYPDFTNYLCSQCDSTCLNCSQTATWCISCQNNTQFLFGGQCYDNCSGLGSYYGFTNLTYKACLPCHSTCETCTGPSSSQCSSCPDSLNLNGTQCVSNCSIGQFRDSGYCINCSVNCSTCYSIYDTACTSCVTGSFLNSLSQCVQICDLGYFADQAQGMCKSCDNVCQTCSVSPTNCTSCPQLTYRQGTTCVSQCTNPYYFDQANQACYPCYNACTSCFGPSQSQCMSCAPQFYLSQYTCTTTCPDGYYGGQYGTTGMCQICHSSCLTCTNFSDTSCTKCRNGFLLQSGKCVVGCPTYLQTSLPNCFICDSNTSKCLNCSDSKTFFVNSTGQCAIINCDLMSTSTTCKSCKIGFGLSIDGRYCLDNALNTLKCARYDTDGKICKDCISGWGLDNVTKQCSVNLTTLQIPGCTKYINTTACQECNNFYGLQGTTCVDNSLNGSALFCKLYASGSPLTCTQCQQDYGLNTADKKCFQLTYVFVNNSLARWNTAGKYTALDATCPSNYILYNEGCVIQGLIDSCTTYYYDTTAGKFLCKQCLAGLVPSLAKDKCITEVPGCYAYNANGSCLSCNKPLTFSAGQCISQYLPGQFIGCRELNVVCLNCWTENGFGQYPNATTGQCYCLNSTTVLNTPINNAQWYCTAVKAGCDPITNNTNCTCKAYLDQTKCKTCWNSSFMLSPDSTQCLGPYKAANVNCSYQWRTGSCFQCKTGYILMSGVCKLIPTTRANYLSLCAEANSNYICTRCKIGYKLNSTSTTTPCYQTTTSGRLLQSQLDFLYSYCAIYDENRSGYCLQCQNPQVAIDGVCYDRLTYCDQQSTPYSCDSCFSGFYLKNDGTCEKNPDNLVPIENCLKFNADFSRCSVCQSGNLLSTTGRHCIPNCKVQDEIDPSKCGVATQNYVVIEGVAIQQQEAVQTYDKANYCSSFDTVLSGCVLCQEGYGLYQGACISNSINVPNCKEYSPQSLGECSVCIDGYIPVKGNLVCYYNQGSSKVLGCNILSQNYDGSNNQCDPLGCDVNYTYDTATKTCVQQQQLLSLDADNQKKNTNSQQEQKTKLGASYIALIVVMTLIAVVIIGVVVVIIKKKQKLIQQAKIRPVSNQNDSLQIDNSNHHNSTLGIINKN